MKIKTDCVYNAENQCLPPDSNTLIKCECDICQNYIKLLTDKEISDYFNDILSGFSTVAKIKIEHPKSYHSRELQKEVLFQKLVSLEKLNFTSPILELFNQDILSQIVHRSVEWNKFVSSNIVLSAETSPYFIRNPIQVNTLQQYKLIQTTLSYYNYILNYQKKYYCKYCWDNDLQPIFLHRRDRTCRICGNDTRITGKLVRFYYTKDNNNNQYISDTDFSILSLVEFFTDAFKKDYENQKILSNIKGKKK